MTDGAYHENGEDAWVPAQMSGMSRAPSQMHILIMRWSFYLSCRLENDSNFRYK
jgi:hypothetical protein